MAKDKFPLIFLNPYTKRGSEVYVALDKETYKWYFNHGQARINYKYRDTFEEALGDMLKYADMSKIKPKLPISEVLHWSNIVPKRLPKSQTFSEKKYKLLEEDIADVNYIRSHLVRKYKNQGYLSTRTVKNPTTGWYGLYGRK